MRLLLLLASVQLCAWIEPIEDRSQLHILTPSLAQRQTRKARLANGIEVLLISDPGVHSSGAALSVEVGSWQDPDTRHGQAHICEHMLFLGNAKYPQEGGLKRFLDDHGGRANAGTGDQMTFYMFSVANDAFAEAIDRFAHMFISPLFDPSALSRETRAVHQEFVRDMELDIWREHHVEQELGRSSHPFSRFCIGNLDTLGDLTHQEIHNWWSRHYSANLMHLVLLSPLPLAQLERLADDHFGAVPNRELEPFVVSGPRFTPERADKLLVVEPHQQLRQLDLTWELPYNQESDALDLISFVLGHEGEGSLLAHLRALGLADSLATQVSRHRKPYTTHCLFGLRIGLTRDGFTRRDEVIAQVFGALAYLQATGIPPYLHDEMVSMQRLKYTYQTREDAFTAVSQHARLLVAEDLATYPDGLLCPLKRDPGPMLNRLSPQACCLTLIAPQSATQIPSTHTERWMGVPYALVDVDKSAWTEASPLSVAPPPNPYLPGDLALRHSFEAGQLPSVQHLGSDDYGTSYFAPDTHYLVPEIAWSIRIRSYAAPLHSSAAAVLTDLLIHCADESLATTSYAASMAGLDYSLVAADEGVVLNLHGYSDRADHLLEKILSTLSSVHPTRAQFARYKEVLKHKYQNELRTPPVEQAIDLTKGVLFDQHHSPGERLFALNRIGYEKFNTFVSEFRERTYTETLLFGNLTEAEARRVVAILRTGFQQQPGGRASTKGVVQLPSEMGPYYLVKRVESPGNALVLAIQQGDFGYDTRAAQQVLSRAIAEPFYTELRTRQQTGYAIWSWDQEIERQLFTFFALQSSSHNTRDLLARFELFFENFLRNLPPASRVEAIKMSLIDALARTPKNPQEMAALLHTLAFEHEGNFNFLSQRMAAIQALDYDAFTAFAHQTLSPANRQRVACCIQGRGDAFTWRRAKSAKQLRDCCAYVRRS